MDDLIEIEDAEGRKVTVSRAHWDRYPSLAGSFRPVAEKKKATEVVVTPPTGDKTKEQ